jgi:hypothetical protein
MNKMTRREALELCALSLLVTQVSCTTDVQLDELSRQNITSYGSNLTHLESCKAVGRRWLENQSKPFDPREVYESLFAPLQETADLNARQTALRRSRKQDFESGRIINHDGWLMSETELKVYALIATL